MVSMIFDSITLYRVGEDQESQIPQSAHFELSYCLLDIEILCFYLSRLFASVYL